MTLRWVYLRYPIITDWFRSQDSIKTVVLGFMYINRLAMKLLNFTRTYLQLQWNVQRRQKNCFRVACVYNSPCCDKLTLIQKMSTWSSVLANSKHPSYNVGDMNINLLESNTTSSNYIESMLLSGFTQHLAKPTRVTSVSKTLLDHVFHKKVLQKTYDVIILSITHHYATKVIKPCRPTKGQNVIT